MHIALRRSLAGALAFVVAYLVIGVVTATRITRYLTPDPIPGVTILEVYESTGRPLWQVIGWFTLNAHGIPVTVSGSKGNLVNDAILITDSPLWLGFVPGWVGVVPMIACLLVGAAVATRERSTPSASVGTYMIPGYVVAVLLSTYLFSGAVGPIAASFELIGTYPPEKWLLPVVLYPSIFGSLGAFLSQTDVFERTYERILSDIPQR